MIRFKKAILIIHGYAGGTYDQEELANYLEMINKFDVYRFTLPGHMKNLSKVKYEDWINKSEEQLNMLIENGYKAIYLIGHSMGGVIACYLASKYPQVKRVVLAAPAFYYLGVNDKSVDIRKSIKDSTSLIKTYGRDEIIARFLKLNIITVKEFDTLIRKYHDCPKEIKCPILIIYGDNDRLVPIESCRYVYDNVLSKEKTLIIARGLTHDLFKTARNEDLFIIIKKFLLISYKKGEFII